MSPEVGRRPTLHVTQGLPAAGKTTAARKLIADAACPIRYVGLDALRLMLDGQTPTAWWAEGAEESTARAQAALVRQLLADGADVLLDGTHVYPGQVAALAAAVGGLDVDVRVLRVDTPAEVCVARDLERAHPIGEACIRRLAAEWVAAEAGGWRLDAALAGAGGLIAGPGGGRMHPGGVEGPPGMRRGATGPLRAAQRLLGPRERNRDRNQEEPMTEPTEPIRKGLLPCIPPPEWEFHTVCGARTGTDGVALFPGDTGPVVVRRRVSYGDWEPVRPDRWAPEPPTEARAVSAGVAPATGQAAWTDAAVAAGVLSRRAATDQAALLALGADAIRAAACPGNCGAEEECAQTRIQPVVWHHGVLAAVEGTPEQFAAAVLAVLPLVADRVAVLDEAADRLDARAAEFTAAARKDPLAFVKGATDARYRTADAWNAAAEELRRMAAESAPATTPQPVRHAPGKAIRCPDCRDKGHAVCMAAEQAAAAQQPETPALFCVCGAPAHRDGDRWTHQPGTGDHCLYRPNARPRCPDCRLPHDLTPGGMAMRACASILASIADRDAAARQPKEA